MESTRKPASSETNNHWGLWTLGALGLAAATAIVLRKPAARQAVRHAVMVAGRDVMDLTKQWANERGVGKDSLMDLGRAAVGRVFKPFTGEHAAPPAAEATPAQPHVPVEVAPPRVAAHA